MRRRMKIDDKLGINTLIRIMMKLQNLNDYKKLIIEVVEKLYIKVLIENIIHQKKLLIIQIFDGKNEI
jgi:hypothetical protein